ncbi:MAG: RNA-directed DNA polymerase [Candidatus Moraniibacteriota bacterium]|nr:MAG: RNA-directed DNA polymerase [Candidatus Moranbacteria bacterium]
MYPEHRQFLLNLGLDEKQASFFYSNIKRLYIEIKIPKKKSSGGMSERILNIPRKDLRLLQKKILTFLKKSISLLPCVHGGVDRRSIVTNAKPHVGKEFVLNYDIKDFFPSIHNTRVLKALRRRLNISQKSLGWIVRIATYENQLPQGAPTSPFLSNVVALDLDTKLWDLCKGINAGYTRFFDDITISGGREVEGAYRKGMVDGIIRHEGFLLNMEKKHIAHRTETQHVTGLVVNDKIDLSDFFIESVKCEIEEGLCYFVPEHRLSVQGKVSFVKSINREAGLMLENFYNVTMERFL